MRINTKDFNYARNYVQSGVLFEIFNSSLGKVCRIKSGKIIRKTNSTYFVGQAVLEIFLHVGNGHSVVRSFGATQRWNNCAEVERDDLKNNWILRFPFKSPYKSSLPLKILDPRFRPDNFWIVWWLSNTSRPPEWKPHRDSFASGIPKCYRRSGRTSKWHHTLKILIFN